MRKSLKTNKFSQIFYNPKIWTNNCTKNCIVQLIWQDWRHDCSRNHLSRQGNQRPTIWGVYICSLWERVRGKIGDCQRWGLDLQDAQRGQNTGCLNKMSFSEFVVIDASAAWLHYIRFFYDKFFNSNLTKHMKIWIKNYIAPCIAWLWTSFLFLVSVKQPIQSPLILFISNFMEIHIQHSCAHSLFLRWFAI